MCTHTIVTHQFVGDRIVAAFCAVPSCNARLPLGPANDADVPDDEIITAVVAHCDADHAAIEEGGYDWDPTRPLREQRPWSGEKLYDGLYTRAQLAEMDREEDELRAKAIADRKADDAAAFGAALNETMAACDRAQSATAAMIESFAALVGPTDQGQPLTDAECAAIIAQSSDSYEPFDGGMTGYIDPGQLQRLTEMCGPVNTVPLVVKLDGGEPFVVGDFADKQPWADPEATTRLTDDELVKTVAYCPPGSVQE